MKSPVTNAPGELLVAILNEPRDYHFARDEHWYRIPVTSVHKFLRDRWPPRRIAFYQTKIFEEERYSVRYFADVLDINRVGRRQLFPDEPDGVKSSREYYRLRLGPLQLLPAPIFSRRARRIVFIPSSWEKFTTAVEINDLYHGSPLEDRLWAALKRRNIPAEREEYLTASGQEYALDFAVYCVIGGIDIETDGDTYHANPEKAEDDNRRNNNLAADGWRVLRYTTSQIHEEMDTYCIPKIVATIDDLGGIDDIIPRKVDSRPDRPYQMSLFDR